MIINLWLCDGDKIHYLTDPDKDSFYLLDNYIYFQHIDPWVGGISAVAMSCMTVRLKDLADLVQSLNERIRDTSDPDDHVILFEDDLDGHDEFVEFVRNHEYREDG